MGTTVLTLDKQLRKVRFVFELEKEFPSDWDDSLIEFHMNESSWCVNNAIDDLESYALKLEEQGYCLCASFKGELVKE